MKYLILLFATPLLLISCNKADKITPKTVTYNIECDDCSVFWKNENGEQQHASNQDSSWEYTFEGKTGDCLEIAVTNTQGTHGYNRVSILINGDELNSCYSSCPISGAAVLADTLE